MNHLVLSKLPRESLMKAPRVLLGEVHRVSSSWKLLGTSREITEAHHQEAGEGLGTHSGYVLIDFVHVLSAKLEQQMRTSQTPSAADRERHACLQLVLSELVKTHSP